MERLYRIVVFCDSSNCRALWISGTKKKSIKINLTGEFLGLGDLLFFVAMIPYFSFTEYIVLLITGMALSLLAQKIIQLFYRSDSIPLAGWLSVFYGLYMLITF